MLGMIYKSMRATIIKSDLVEQDPGTDIFESMLDDSLMEQASETGSFGLAEALYRQLSKQSGSGAKNDGEETGQEAAPVTETSEE